MEQDAAYRDAAARRFQDGRRAPVAQPLITGMSRQGSVLGGRRTWRLCGGVCIGVALGFLVLVVVLSLGSLKPNEYGIVFNYVTNRASEVVYRGGVHFIGPFSRFVRFPAAVRTIEFSDKQQFTGALHLPPLKTRSPEGLAIVLSLSFQYRLHRDSLPQLYKIANLQYENLFARTSRDVLLKTASEFKANDYWEGRRAIGVEMTKKTREKLFELHADLHLLNVLRIDLPTEWEEKIVGTQVAQQEIQTEKMKQEALRIRADTEVIAADFDRRAAVLRADGAANASFIVQQAEARAKQKTLEAEASTLDFARTELFPDEPPESVVRYQSLTALQDKGDGVLAFGNNFHPIIPVSHSSATG